MVNQKPVVAFLGGGNMSKNIIGGLAQTPDLVDIVVADRNPGKLKQLVSDYGVRSTSDILDAATQADVWVLSVKPTGIRDLCHSLAGLAARKNPLIISVAAGIELEAMSRWLGGQYAIVRSMPNIPSSYLAGMTGLVANESVNSQQKALTESLFSAIGKLIWLPKEKLIHAVTAVSGSGPAYFFLFMEAMEKSAESLGLDSDVARELVMQTALGAAVMAEKSPEQVSELRRQVMSPNGTTEAAIHSFEQDGLRNAVHQAMIACLKRSEAIAEELSTKE